MCTIFFSDMKWSYRQGENEIMELIFGFCVFGCGVTRYFIGHKAGVKLGAGLMFDTLYKMGKENPDNPRSC